ncbi:MAG: nickel pincer cofactor biosynthesis protein LarC [Solobacterium sp.]|nr:nickel pincer cofactor biosynthesis protein LarC [Solobacterium sp.]
MKILYIECNMGAAGDMLMGALSELADQAAFIEKMNALNIPGMTLSASESFKCGIKGTHMSVVIDGEEEVSEDIPHEHHHHDHEDHDHEHHHDHDEDHEHHHHDHEDHDHEHHHQHEHDEDHEHHHDHEHAHHHHDHEHGHHHHHHHTSLADIEKMVSEFNVSDQVKADVLAVYRLIAEAESNVHNEPVEQIHFHEVGSIDAVTDVTGVCVLMEMIGADKVVVSPVATGSGFVRCAHGILPVPAPATEYLLRGIPSYAGREKGELCTPTGAALLKHFGDVYEERPVMSVEKTGYGMGTKDFAEANCVRAFLGETKEETGVKELVCNLDDESPEAIGFAMEELFAAGALDVYITPVQMKKNRPGVVFTCMCRAADKEKMMELMFRHLTTLGIREYTCERHALRRSSETLATAYGDVRLKRSEGYGVIREKLEYEDLARIARETGKGIEEIRAEIEKERKQ